jgi:hypothetical protein
MSFFSFFCKIRDHEGCTGLAWGEGALTQVRGGKRWGEDVGERMQILIPVETIPGIGDGGG